jgi:acetoin utilization deacetylase AcuC-like enzyme
VLIVSLGLDTHLGDPCAIRRAGFGLAGDDYRKMGTLMAEKIQNHIPTVFVQEGGYRMDKIADAAADVVISFAQRRNQS